MWFSWAEPSVTAPDPGSRAQPGLWHHTSLRAHQCPQEPSCCHGAWGCAGASPAASLPPAHTAAPEHRTGDLNVCLVKSLSYENSAGRQDRHPVPTVVHEGVVPGQPRTTPGKRQHTVAPFLALCTRKLPAEEARGAARNSLQRLLAI